MKHPVPVAILSLVIPLLAVGLLGLCARWLIRSSRMLGNASRWTLLVGIFLLGAGLAYRFAMCRYEYNADWQMVGWPIPAVPLERTVLPGGRVLWKDWIGVNLLVGFLANVLFWLLLPAAPCALLVWLLGRNATTSLPGVR